MNNIMEKTPGIMFCFAISVPAWFLGEAFPIIGSPIIGILAGMITITFYPGLLSKARLEDGVKFTAKKILQYSIILLGFGMNLYHIVTVGSQSLLVMLFTLSAALLTAIFIGKVLKLEGKVVTLIGVGTSICGGSAIAATAPVIEAKNEEVAHSISTIFLFNIIAVFIFPASGFALEMSDMGFGMWAGTAINDTSSVVAAGTAWSNAVGNNTTLAFATIVKLTRTLMIVPITLVLAIYTARKVQKSQNLKGGSEFSVIKVFPWFVIGFVVAAIINTFVVMPEVTDMLVTVSKFLIVMAMVAIGLNTNLKKLLTNGFRPILLGLCCWLAIASVSLLVQSLTGMW